MVDEKEGKEIKDEASEITAELDSVFDSHFRTLLLTGTKGDIIYDIVSKTLVCKANRDNPNYPNPKDKSEFEKWQERQEKNIKRYGETQKEIKEHPEHFRWINGAPVRKIH